MNLEKQICIDFTICPQNHTCPAMSVCPVNAIDQKNFELPLVDSQKCILCGKCVNFCPKNAIHFHEIGGN